jgi:hypothetical protein
MIAAVTLISATSAEAGTTKGDKEALVAAKEYLSSQAFSLKGLIAQLDSPDGGQFTVAQATYGVQHTGANWDKEALADGQGVFELSTLFAEGAHCPVG